MGADGILRESVGLETLGGVFTPLLRSGCEVPCSSTEVFSTAADNQDQILIHLYRGNSPTVTGAHDLGTFKVVGIPAQSRGTPSVEVTVAAKGQQITISARDQRSGTAFAIDTAPATKQ